MTDNPSPFHVAANPRDTAESVARRYRAVFGNDAWDRAGEDEDKAEELGLPRRRFIVAEAQNILFAEDVASGLRDQWGEKTR